MEIINEEKLNYYINKYNIDDLFSKSMRKYMTLHMWKAGEYLCREGEPLNYIFFITRGKAKVYKNFENGKSLLICFYDPFKIIGDMEFTRTNLADCSVKVIKDVYAVGIKFEEAGEILLNDCRFLRNICEYLGEKLSKNSTNSAINLLYPLENRLASYILAYLNYDEDDAYEESKNSDLSDEIKFEFEGNYGEIAELLGTSYRHLNRTLKRMCEDNIIRKDERVYKVLDYDKLVALSGDLYK
ncbi:MAG: cyclic nucleotide-binding domain-containing protein [Clostridium sp.]|nr:cyclic nucleotide-binding domain-containing protein [Clostridium sp.]